MDNNKKAIEILNIFEEFLEEHNITIPSKDREEDEMEARIYGTVYYELEDSITRLLEDFENGR